MSAAVTKERRPLQLCLVAVAITTSCVQAAAVQDAVDDRSIDEYASLLDTIFPLDLTGTQYAFAVRLEPSFGRESQLVVKVFPDDSVSAELSEVTGRSAWEALSARERSGANAIGIAELAKTIEVRTRAVDVDRETAHGWQTSLFEAVRASTQELETATREAHVSELRTVRVVADGVWYRIWYSQGAVRFDWDFGDVEPESAKSTPVLPLTRWIADMLETAEQKAARE